MSLLATSPAYAAEDRSFGLGAGTMYSGLGVNYTYRGEGDMVFLGAGCVALGYSQLKGLIAPCGVGAGWLDTHSVGIKGKHGVGIYLGPVGLERTSGIDNYRVVYGMGIPYVYFFKSARQAGWNAGVTPAIGHWDGKTRIGVGLQLGYQF